MTSSEANNPMNCIDIKIIPYRIIDLNEMPATGTSLLIAFAGGTFQRNVQSVIRQEKQVSLAEFFPHWKERRSVANVLQTGRADPLNSFAF
jgi:hypothetical protein